MNRLTPDKLMSLEQYARERAAFRSRVLAHKKHRRVDIGPNLTLYFEDQLTIQYQVQEMLRIEKVFETKGIEDELEAYNPLIPDGRNLKATVMLEFEEVAERRARLAELVGLEHQVWLQVSGSPRVFSIANEDMERSNADKTAAVHFMRFELDESMVSALKSGASLSFGCDHPAYHHQVTVTDQVRTALLADLH